MSRPAEAHDIDRLQPDGGRKREIVQPDNTVRADIQGQELLDILAAQRRIAIVVQDRGLKSDQRADPVGLDTTGFQGQRAGVPRQRLILQQPCGKARVRLVVVQPVAPAVEADVDARGSLNTIDSAITFATIEPDRIVEPGDLVATVKIIPLGVPEASVAEAERTAALISIAPLEKRRAGLVLTTLPGVKAPQLDRAEQSQRQRLAALGCTLAAVERVAHDEDAVAEAIRRMDCDPILLLGASAITDPNDVIPAAIRRAGGEVLHVGMPVDPGNLLVLGAHQERTVIGVPGCARSLARSGFDRVLERTVAGVAIRPSDIMQMGVGGLMKDIDTRPHPRHAPTVSTHRIGAVVLAAGQSKRMGARNKLLAEVNGQPMVRRAVGTLVEAEVSPIVVVVGHEADAVRAALDGCDVDVVHNADFANGLSTSIRAGAGAIDGRVDGALFMLSDMPWVTRTHLESLIAAFDPETGHSICVPTHAGRRGNPILWSARFFRAMQRLTGDVGARPLLAEHAAQIVEVEVSDRGVHFDVDTPQALAELDAPEP